jgi:hypothetical protein
LVIFCISWKLGSINDIYETLTRFLSMKLCKSDIIRWIFASWTKIHFDPFKWYFNGTRDYMGVQSIFGLFLQTIWKETTSSRVEKIYVKTSFNIPLKHRIMLELSLLVSLTSYRHLKILSRMLLHEKCRSSNSFIS